MSPKQPMILNVGVPMRHTTEGSDGAALIRNRTVAPTAEGLLGVNMDSLLECLLDSHVPNLCRPLPRMQDSCSGFRAKATRAWPKTRVLVPTADTRLD